MTRLVKWIGGLVGESDSWDLPLDKAPLMVYSCLIKSRTVLVWVSENPTDSEVSKVENVLLKLIAKAEVQANLEAEKQAEAERYAKGVEAMKRRLEFA